MRELRWAAAAVGFGILAAGARAETPAWVQTPCLGLDCATTLVGVGQADLLPDPRISSAIAYAFAVRGLSSVMSDVLSANDRVYNERQGRVGDAAAKNLAASPLGSALTKNYGDENSDVLSVAVQIRRLEDERVKVYAQESVDEAARALYVRVFMNRPAASPEAGARDDAALEARLKGEAFPWKGRRARVSIQHVRVSRRDELTMWVEDNDAGLTWVEHWPTGGADLLQDGRVRAKYVYDKFLERWTPAGASLD